MIRVMIADDHEIVRKGLRLTLTNEEDILLVGEAKNGLEVLDLLENIEADILLMDIQMPFMDGIKASVEVNKKFPAIKIIILTNYSEDETIYSALRSRVTGYLLKDINGDDLIKAIRGAFQGEPQLHPQIARYLMENVPSPVDPMDILSIREREILVLIAKGNSNKEIGSKLNLSEATIKGYISSLLEKLDVSDRTQAALLAIKHGIVKPGELA